MGTLLLGNCLHKLWVIREDMQQTLKQEQELREENLRLKNQRDQLQNPDEISHEAREQFGLVKPGEIPYKRWDREDFHNSIEFLLIYGYNDSYIGLIYKYIQEELKTAWQLK